MRTALTVAALLLLLVTSGCPEPLAPLPEAPVPETPTNTEATCDQLARACSSVGETRCAAGGIETCGVKDGCLEWSEAIACAQGSVCVEGGRCQSCDGTPGTFSAQMLQSGGEPRYYFLHVPSTYRCDTPAPVLFDFHGTASDVPEEAYGLKAALRLADEQGAILVRPRSRFSTEGSWNVYRWDQNPGDLTRNTAYATDLFEALAGRYYLDRSRTYAMGFSSGTNMAAQFLSRADSPFKGLGLVGGGQWAGTLPTRFEADAPRIYSVTGFRDYMYSNTWPLLRDLSERQYPLERLFVRQTDTGHELYDWHYPELWTWLDRGEKPENGTLAAGWAEEATGTTEALTELARAPSGEYAATATNGTILRRTADGAWSTVANLAGAFPPAWVGLCFLPDGTGVAVGEGQVARSVDSGKSWSLAQPIKDGIYFGAAHLNAVACSGTSIIGGGYWTGVRSDDGGKSWVDEPMMVGGSYDAQVSSVAIAPDGTAVSVGYWRYLAHRSGTAGFQDLYPPGQASWITTVTAGADGSFWIAGDHGTVARTTADVTSWLARMPGTTADLYAVAALDGAAAAVVGAGGTVRVTTDGGATFLNLDLGVDRMLAGVAFLDANTLLVVGEGGGAWRRTFR